MSNVMERKWNSLGQLRDYFEKTSEEKVVNYDGVSLTTKKYVYTLVTPTLYRDKR